MKMYTKLFIAAAILFILPFGGGTILLAIPCFIAGLILLIFQGIKETTSKTPKQGNDNRPPWEK